MYSESFSRLVVAIVLVEPELHHLDILLFRLIFEGTRPYVASTGEHRFSADMMRFYEEISMYVYRKCMQNSTYIDVIRKQPRTALRSSIVRGGRGLEYLCFKQGTTSCVCLGTGLLSPSSNTNDIPS
jgi:hypothetical protein